MAICGVCWVCSSGVATSQQTNTGRNNEPYTTQMPRICVVHDKRCSGSAESSKPQSALGRVEPWTRAEVGRAVDQVEIIGEDVLM